jgi:hypothetical protein
VNPAGAVAGGAAAGRRGLGWGWRRFGVLDRLHRQQFVPGGGIGGFEGEGPGIFLQRLLLPAEQLQGVADLQVQVGILRLQPFRLAVEQQGGAGVPRFLHAMAVLNPDRPILAAEAQVAGIGLRRLGPFAPVTQHIGADQQLRRVNRFGRWTGWQGMHVHEDTPQGRKLPRQGEETAKGYALPGYSVGANARFRERRVYRSQVLGGTRQCRVSRKPAAPQPRRAKGAAGWQWPAAATRQDQGSAVP